MNADEEKYQRLIKYNKIMMVIAGHKCIIITGYALIQMKAIIIPLVFANIIKFIINNILSLFKKNNTPLFIAFLIKVAIIPIFLIEDTFYIPNFRYRNVIPNGGFRRDLII